MKKVLFVIFAAAVFSACVDRNNTANNVDADVLMAEIAERDSLLLDVFSSLNEIAANLNAIRVREGLLSDAIIDSEYKKAYVSSINEGVEAIDRLLMDNRDALSKLQARAAQLQKIDGRSVELGSLVDELQAHIEEKDRAITELKSRLAELAGEYEQLEDKLEDLESDFVELAEEKGRLEDEVNVQRDNLNAAYYVIGARKDLLDKNIIYKSGAIGRTLKLNENKNLDAFIRIDTRYFTEVMIGQKNIELVTSHPEEAYRLVKGEKGVYTSLVITDPEKFWEYSKILVISHK